MTARRLIVTGRGRSNVPTITEVAAQREGFTNFLSPRLLQPRELYDMQEEVLLPASIRDERAYRI